MKVKNTKSGNKALILNNDHEVAFIAALLGSTTRKQEEEFGIKSFDEGLFAAYANLRKSVDAYELYPKFEAAFIKENK